MARVNNLSNFLTDVASAIKTKKGSETNIPAANFDTEILALPSQGVYEQRVLNISANGSQTITPGAGFDAIDELTLTVAVPEKQLQSKTYNFTQNTTIQLLPDTGYDGFDVVTLNIEVPSSQINNQDKTVTQNGTYQADSGYTGLGTVIVNVTPDLSDATAQAKDILQGKTAYTGTGKITGNLYAAKLFNTIQEMNNYTDASDGDLAMVYTGGIGPVREGQEVKVFILKKTIVLEEQSSDDILLDFGDYQTGQLRVMMSDSSLEFNFDQNGSYERYNYTSSDGITYVLQDYDTDQILLSYDITLESEYSDWNDIMTEILFTKTGTFGGLYQYVTNITDSKKYYLQKLDTLRYTFNNGFSNISLDTTDLVLIDYDKLKRIRNTIPDLVNSQYTTSVFYIGDKLCLSDATSVGNPVVNSAGEIIGTSGSDFYDMPDSGRTAKVYEVDLINETATFLKTVSVVNFAYGSYWDGLITSTNSQYVHQNDAERQYFDDKSNYEQKIWYVTSDTRYEGSIAKGDKYGTKNEYQNAPTQFTLAHSYELLPNVSGYGNEEVIGDGTIFDHIPKDTIFNRYFGLSKVNEYELYGDKYAFYSDPSDLCVSSITPAKLHYLKASNTGTIYIGKITNTIITNEEEYKKSIAYSTDKQKYFCLGAGGASIKNINNTTLLSISDMQSYVGQFVYGTKVYWISKTDKKVHYIDLDAATIVENIIDFDLGGAYTEYAHGTYINDTEVLFNIGVSWKSMSVFYLNMSTNTVRKLVTITYENQRIYFARCSFVHTDKNNLYCFLSHTNKRYVYKWNGTDFTTLFSDVTDIYNDGWWRIPTDYCIEENNILYNLADNNYNTVSLLTGQTLTKTVWTEYMTLYYSTVDGEPYMVGNDDAYTQSLIYTIDNVDVTNFTYDKKLVSTIPLTIWKKINNNMHPCRLNVSISSEPDRYLRGVLGYVDGHFIVNSYGADYIEIIDADTKYEETLNNFDLAIISTVVNSKNVLAGFVGNNIFVVKEEIVTNGKNK